MSSRKTLPLVLAAFGVGVLVGAGHWMALLLASGFVAWCRLGHPPANR